MVDGHKRYRICERHGIEPSYVERDFESRDDAMIWIIGEQLKRTSLTAGQKAVLAIDMYEAEIREEVRRGISSARRRGKTDRVLAKRNGIAHTTVSRVMRVKKLDKGLYEKLRKGEISVMSAYAIATGDKTPTPGKDIKFSDDGRRICTLCGKPIDEGDEYKNRPTWHRSCGTKHVSELSRKYRNADHDLRENVPTYTVQSLASELRLTAESMRSAIQESIQINEQMGVTLTKQQRYDLRRSISRRFNAIDKITKE